MLESRAVGFMWTECEALKEMLKWVGEERRADVHARVDAVRAMGFSSGANPSH